MQLAVLGLNHSTSSLEVREKFAMTPEKIRDVLDKITRLSDIDEAVLLSTCNRTELYAVFEDTVSGLPAMQSVYEEMAGEIPSPEHFYYYKNEDAMRHLFRVAAGMNSLVVGEGQILSQVKVAYLEASKIGATGPVTNTLFQRALAIGKKVRTETSISDNPVSVSYAAVKLAQQVLGSLTEKRVLILGAGTMSELMAKHLIGHGVTKLIVANRSPEKAEELVLQYGGRAVPLEERLRWAGRVDIILTSTGATDYLINYGEAAELMQKRRGNPLIMIDIAVPRDIDPQVKDIDGITLYNVDDLTEVVEENKRLRSQEAEAAYPLIEEAVQELIEKYGYFSIRPLMVEVTDRFDAVRRRIVKRAFAKLPDLTEKERRVIEGMSRVLVRKLLREPMIRFREIAGTDEENIYWQMMEEVYQLQPKKGRKS